MEWGGGNGMGRRKWNGEEEMEWGGEKEMDGMGRRELNEWNGKEGARGMLNGRGAGGNQEEVIRKGRREWGVIILKICNYFSIANHPPLFPLH